MKKYDVFLSYKRNDWEAVARIAERLGEQGVKFFLDQRSIVPGDRWQEALERALNDSATCAVFIGPAGFGGWVNEEVRSVLDDGARQPTFRVIPVLLPGAPDIDSDGVPRFLKLRSCVDFRAGVESGEALARLLAGIRGVAPGEGGEAGPRPTPPDALHLYDGIIHPLPPAPVFVGRRKELAALKEFWEGKDCNVLSLVGLGGAGKTAIIAEFLSRLLSGELARPESLFVWSFYVDQEVNNFLRAAYRHFTREAGDEAAGTGLLYRLKECLTKGGPKLFVLDGLERVQRPDSDARCAFGGLEDPLMRQVVTGLASGSGRTKAVITSRFPISDLWGWRGKGYRPLEIDQLDDSDARLLLRKHGIRGGDSELDPVIEEFGAHALTLDHLGAYLAEFRGGDPGRAHELPVPRVDSDIPQERKLARVFYAYEQALRKTELDLLKRICIFRFGVRGETLYNMFAKSSGANRQISGSLAGVTRDDLQRLLRRLTNLHLILRESEDRFTAHPAVRDHFYSLFTNRPLLHGAVESAFREELAFDLQDDWKAVADIRKSLAYAEKLFRERALRAEKLPELTARLKEETKKTLRAAKRHLPKPLRQELEKFVAHGDAPELLSNYPYTNLDLPPELEGSWRNLRHLFSHWRTSRNWDRASASADLKELRTRLCEQLRSFVSQHESRLSPESAEQIRSCLKVFDAGGSAQLPAVWLRHARLAIQPGVSLPSEPAMLDLIEELVYHAIKAGHHSEATQLYEQRLGGRDHLGSQLGEYARGLRILRSFPVCPNRLDMAWYLRGVGDLQASYEVLVEQNPFWAGAVLSLMGRLPAVVAGTYWYSTQFIAQFLSGRADEDIKRVNLAWGEIAVKGELYLLKGDLEGARISNDSLAKKPDEVRGILVAAEVERRSGDLDRAAAELDLAAQWVLRSASVEHLCFYHLIRARLLRDRKDFEGADTETREGINLARTSGLVLAHADLLNERARLLIAMGREAHTQGEAERARGLMEEAEHCTLAALNGLLRDTAAPPTRADLPPDELLIMGTQHPECQYVWGSADALLLLGESLLRRNLHARAHAPLEQALGLYESLGHPGATPTRKMLDAVSWDS